MNINEILKNNYPKLVVFCQKNQIKSVENCEGIRDIEDLDLLNTMCLRWLKKYKTAEFVDDVAIFNKLKKEFLIEKKLIKKDKPNTKKFIAFSDLYRENLKLNDMNDFE